MAIKGNPFDALRAGIILGSEGFIEGIKKKTGLKKHREIPESKRLIKGIRYEDIMATVVKRFRVREQDIRVTGRCNNLIRRIAIYLLRKHTDTGNEELGRYFGVGYTAVS